ncbi:cytochrome b [Comamonas badia]|uniref:cytochrome b n=1 Tax=Comamonas badia TaxID=265291 RepID=UPI0004285675|nr:cytochrome b [Comamonas badia]
MRTAPSLARYPAPLIALHWLTLALMIGVYALIQWHDALPKGSELRTLAKAWHETLGVAVFALVLLRLPLRWWLGVPPALAGTPRWQHRLASSMHWALYGLLIAAPLLGYLSLNAKGTPVPFFGLQMPAFLGPDRALAGNLKEIHEAVGTLGYWLIGGHAAAALVHHYGMRDGTLARMGWARTQPASPPPSRA